MIYHVEGTDRAETAIGKVQPFAVLVKDAINEEDARSQARELRYAAGREHVSIRKVVQL